MSSVSSLSRLAVAIALGVSMQAAQAEEEAKELGTVTVVGDWLGEADQAVVQNHPGARSVVRRREMLESGAQNVRDVLRKVPGVQVQDNNGTGGSDISLNVGVRGLTSRLSPRSTVMIDGVPAAVAPYGQPQLSMMPLSIGNLESIDVVRGAGSVRYGPQNVGGVNFHYYDAYADMPGGLTQAQYDDDPFQSVRDWDNFRGRRKDFSLKYTRQVDDLTQFEVLTYYSDSFRGSSIAARNLRTITSYPRDYHVFAVEPRVSRIFFAGPTTQEIGIGYRYLKEAMNERASQLALVDNVPTVRPGSDGHTYQDRTGGTEASAFYIDDKIDVGNWTITPGIRFEKIDSDWRDRPVLGLNGKPVQEKKRSKDYNEPLPALSLMYHLSDEWKLFANYSESFGSLQYFQLGQGGSGNDTAAGLEPERAKTYELGTRYDNGSWGGEITLFYIDFDDELQYVSNDVGWTNLGATKHQGIETSGHYDFAALDPRLDGLSVYGRLTYTRATYEGDIPSFKGRDLPLYSRQVATAGVRYEVDRWTYNLDAFAQSMQRAPGLSTDSQGNFTHNYITEPSADGQYGDIPGYVTWNARVGYDFGPQASNLKLGLGVKNLFDKQYFTRSSDNNSGIYVGQPRTLFMQASVGF
ncbi:TonB-dependent receptor [Pseudomonas aeruginosa]|nr:TonB-dependent receptor [Pseudomonas aeruginosa]